MKNLSEEEEKAIDNLFHLQHINTYLDLSKERFRIENKTIIKWKESTAIVLNLITRLEKENENSISKDIVKKYLEEEQERYNVYKREVEQNNNLKSGLWRHLGAKNMCEKILGIERLVTLD